MSCYRKRGNCRTFPEYVREKSGKDLLQLNQYSYYHLMRIKEAAEKLSEAVASRRHLEVHSDFDADGIGSAVQFLMILRHMNARNYQVYLPRRFSDGYGIQKKHVETMPAGSLLITLDNGIAALEALEYAEKKGIEILVLDHHLASADGILPPAHLIIDPEALPEGNGYTGYCAAGLVNRLAHTLFPYEEAFLARCDAVAAISTVADGVPLTEDNRRIVQNGLYAMNTGRCSEGLLAVIRILNLEGHVDSENLAYQLGPMFNAPGRLYDTGATASAAALLEDHPDLAYQYASQLKFVNENRKRQTAAAMERMCPDPGAPLQFLRMEGICPGLLGLLAGKVAEEYRMPALLYQVNHGLASGSARSDDETANHVKLMLDFASDLLVQYGGHAGAAGFKFRECQEAALRERLMAYPVKPHTDQKFYDLDLVPEEAFGLLAQMDQAEPFGKGLERPVFRVEMHAKDPNFWKPMGDGSHLALQIGPLRAVAFGMRERFERDHYPEHVFFYGSLVWNWYQGNRSPSFRIEDYKLL